jgi:hypothetical protein
MLLVALEQAIWKSFSSEMSRHQSSLYQAGSIICSVLHTIRKTTDDPLARKMTLLRNPARRPVPDKRPNRTSEIESKPLVQ